MLNVVLQVFTEKLSIVVCIGSCVMYRDTYRICKVVYRPTPSHNWYNVISSQPLIDKQIKRILFSVKKVWCAGGGDTVFTLLHLKDNYFI